MARRWRLILGIIAATSCGRTDLAGRSGAADDELGAGDGDAGNIDDGDGDSAPGDTVIVVESCYDGPCGPCGIDAECASCERCVAGTCHVEPIREVFLGHRDTCFLGDAGSRWCVGEGNGVGLAPGTAPNMPVHVEGDDGWTRLALGWMGGLGQRNGELVQWALTDPPVSYLADVSWVDLVNDRDDYCLRHADGTAMCDDTDVGGGWSQVDPGPNHRCGIQSGAILCWGTDLSNVLGQGVEADDTLVATPTQVGTDTDWATVSISNTLACALKTDRSLWCWGEVQSTGTNGVDTLGVPTRLGTDNDWLWMEVAWDHACAGRAGGRVFCWGQDGYGLEVVPGETVVQAPTELAQTWDDFRLGGHHYCGRTGGRWYCWGWNDAGQLGVGNTVTTNTPTSALCVPTQ